jgi:hippurate hydrolase
VTDGIGRFGVIGTLRGRLPGQRSIGLRVDMDALAIQKATDPHYASVTAVDGAAPIDGDTPPRLSVENFAAMLTHCPGAFMLIGGDDGRLRSTRQAST